MVKVLLIFICLLSPWIAECQNAPSINILFYNVENLFDTIDDPLTEDQEFLPTSLKEWNQEKYQEKLLKIYKVIIASGKWNPPAIIGLAEIENYKVLDDLVTLTPINKLNYGIIHHPSKDKRGIEVAALYRKDIFEIISSKKVCVDLYPPTRDILYFTGKTRDDTIHFYVNHWPSRIGGKEYSEKLRLAASNRLIHSIDSLYSNSRNAKVIVMGDFNDEPNDSSLHQFSQAQFIDKDGKVFQFQGIQKTEGVGTTVYTDVFKNWFLFDQILISNNIKEVKDPEIVKPFWLLNSKGDPNRTYLGNYYNGGVSDHLPVQLEIQISNK